MFKELPEEKPSDVIGRYTKYENPFCRAWRRASTVMRKKKSLIIVTDKIAQIIHQSARVPQSAFCGQNVDAVGVLWQKRDDSDDWPSRTRGSIRDKTSLT